jgi:glycerol-3-phosphate dehydrogenase
VVVNHCSVARFIMENGRVKGAEVEDRITGGRHCLRACVVVNATGPWADRIRQLADPSAGSIVRKAKGIHLVYPDLGLKQALLLSAPGDGRIFFLVPWRGLTLIGTTDTDFEGDPAQAQATDEDVRYLIDQTHQALPSLRLERDKIISTFAGVRPLVRYQVRYQVPFLKRYLVPFKDLVPFKEDPWSVSRSHLIHEDPNGLISIVGGKFTTFRSMAEEVVDRLSRRWPKKRLKPCETAKAPLGSSSLRERSEKVFFWLKVDPTLGERLCPHHPFTRAEVRYAVEEEMAMTLSDLLWRRFQVGHSVCHGLDMAQPAAELMGATLGWSSDEKLRQLARYREEVALHRRALG